MRRQVDHEEETKNAASARVSPQPLRNVLLWLHRYAGLAMAIFLIIAGITGSLLAFNSELERIFARRTFAAPQPGAVHLPFAELAERAQAIVPQGRVVNVGHTEADRVMVYFVPRIDPATGAPYKLGFTEFYIDPWTGKETARRNRGDLSEGWINLMPFLYLLHFNLMAGATGLWFMGLIAFVWTIDCFIGFYLTLPRRPGAYWRRWKYAWQVKRQANAIRVNFDLHRATGLWMWPLLCIFAWSSVMMNIRPWYEKVMHSLFDYPRPIVTYMYKARRIDQPRLDWRAAEEIGKRLMAEQSGLRHFTVGAPLALSYSAATGAYAYEVRGSRDVFEREPKGGSTRVTFDGDTGELRLLSQPTGENTGNTIESWLYALHMARVFGRVYQVFVCLLGLLVALLPVTGIFIWWRKRRARRMTALRSSAAICR
jgi:uncharacterized iron-regulated membrane protein